MQVIRAHSPDHGLMEAINLLAESNIVTESRNGNCIRFKTPVTTVWDKPQNRISWSPLRDANPFLHFLESCWMLAGRNDVKLVSTLAKNMANYSDDGETLYGAYGYRWRQHFSHDQLIKIQAMIRKDPTTRRCVLQMWDGSEELDVADRGGKDTCCNTAIYFDPVDGKLNMSVTNRSNDMIWGAYGANVVHMSILHEYMAKQTGLALGSYYQISHNLHMYTNLSDVSTKVARYGDKPLAALIHPTIHDHKQELLFADFEMADDEFVGYLNDSLDEFLSCIEGKCPMSRSVSNTQPFFLQVMEMLMNGFLLYKSEGADLSAEYLEMEAHRSYWVQSALAWVKRRPSYVGGANAS